MSTVSVLELPHYTPAPVSLEKLEYADLAIIDLSLGETEQGRRALSAQVVDAMKTHGFFYALNHGYTQAQTNRVFDIANLSFEGVGDEEKELYTGEINKIGAYQGYKQRSYWRIDGGVMDQIEHYNINRNVNLREHPQALRPFLLEITAFAKHNHHNILHPVLRLMAQGLELEDQETLTKMHAFEAQGESSVRFMKYHPRSAADEEKTKNVWLKGHTDIGSVTILWSQPVGGLQILSTDGKWRWIKHIPNAVVINCGDGMDFLSGGYYRPTIHRVIQPPQDQANLARLGLFYFCMPNDDVKLIPLEKESPVLQRVGAKRLIDDSLAPTQEMWRKERTLSYGRVELKVAKTGHEEEVVGGVTVTHYN